MKQKRLWFLFILAAGCAGPVSAQEAVVLAHGILNKPFFLARVEKALGKEGYTVYNWGYPSTEKTIEELSADVAVFVAGLPAADKVHFVGFSLGSQILRHYLARQAPPNSGRFVMIAPPNHGSPLVGLFSGIKGVSWIYGDKAFLQLDEDNGEFLNSLGTPGVPFGVIAGGWGNGKGFSPLVPGDDDGTVPVESARLEGMADFILLPYEHTWLLAQKETTRQVAAFLSGGHFKK